MSEQTETEKARTAAIAVELHTLVGKLKRRLREQAGPGDMRRSQISILFRLDRDGPSTVTALARAEGMRSQSMGSTIAALEAAGLIIGEPDPSDGRQTILKLTPTCKAWIEDGRAVRQDWLFRALQAQLTPAEQEQVMIAIGLLNRIVET